jgi:hypothetical protein
MPRRVESFNYGLNLKANFFIGYQLKKFRFKQCGRVWSNLMPRRVKSFNFGLNLKARFFIGGNILALPNMKLIEPMTQ